MLTSRDVRVSDLKYVPSAPKYVFGTLRISAVTPCRRWQISSRLVYHLCFVCSCNSPRMVRIGICRAENERHTIIGHVPKLMPCRTAALPACPDLFSESAGVSPSLSQDVSPSL